MDYIINSPQGAQLYQGDTIFLQKHTNLFYIKRLCLHAFFDYSGYQKAVKTKLKRKQLIPVVIDQFNQWIPSCCPRKFDNIWINYISIKEMIPMGSHTKIKFHSGAVLCVERSLESFEKQIKDLILIRNEKVKHFHR